MVKIFLETKRYLREKNVNVIYRKLLYKISKTEKDNEAFNFKIDDLNEFESDETYEIIDLEDKKYSHLKVYVYSFMFLNGAPLKKVRIYKNINTDKEFVINGNEKSQRLTFN
jgi:hypothetical protein